MKKTRLTKISVNLKTLATGICNSFTSTSPLLTSLLSISLVSISLVSTSLVSTSLLSTSLGAHEGVAQEQPEPANTRVLGNIDFPTTTKSKQAQSAFIEGMLLLHLFEYPFAREKFQLARQSDPGFAMAYWGEAMTFNHPVWDKQDLAAAHAVLNELGGSAEARQSRTSSKKEQDYLAALDLLYAEGPKADRDRVYMFHMQQMAATYPDDDEVQLFYALSILGLSAGVRDVTAYMQSTAISQRVFCANRTHPGAAHYLIHGVDDPVHAPLGLEAARALALMAPDAGHSLHMTSHIFTAVGMWDDVVSANEAAVLVQNKMRASQEQPARHWGHYSFWLLYGLLQQGRIDEAGMLLKAAYEEAITTAAVAEEPLELDADGSQLGSLVQMWARYMIETGGKDREIAAWTFNIADAFDPRLTFSYVRALDTADAGTIPAAKQYLKDFRALKDALGKAIFEMERQAPGDLLYLDRLNVMEYEIQARLAYAEHKPDQAVEYAHEASRLEGEMPFSFGPPFIDLPAAELLGNLLLTTGNYEQAALAFEIQLTRTRLKALPLLGLAKAEEKRGNQAAAKNARATLTGIWSHADAGIKALLVTD